MLAPLLPFLAKVTFFLFSLLFRMRLRSNQEKEKRTSFCQHFDTDAKLYKKSTFDTLQPTFGNIWILLFSSTFGSILFSPHIANMMSLAYVMLTIGSYLILSDNM